MFFKQLIKSGSRKYWDKLSNISCSRQFDARSYSLQLFKVASGSSHQPLSNPLVKVSLPPAIQNLKQGELTAFTCGPHHCAAVVNQLLYTWGSNSFGQLGPVNTGFELMESSGDDEIVETPFLVPGAFNLPSQGSFPSAQVTLAAGHFHTVAFDHSNVKIWTWGAGILGRGSEVYDPLPAPITFFADANVKVKQVLSAGDYSLAVQDAKNLDQSLVFIWGYLPSSDMDGKTQTKANFPIVVRDLASDNVRHLAAIPTGFSALVAKSNSHASVTWRLKWFGSTPFKINQTMPYYPYFQENAAQLHSYDFAPSINIPLPFQTPNDEPFHLTVGAGMAGILKSNRLLLIDMTCSSLGDEPKVLVTGFTGIESATLTDEGLSFIKVSNSEAKLYYLPKSHLQPKLQAQQRSNLPTFDELVDVLSQDSNPILENGYSLSLQGNQDLSKVLKYEYGNIWTLTDK